MQGTRYTIRRGSGRDARFASWADREHGLVSFVEDLYGWDGRIDSEIVTFDQVSPAREFAAIYSADVVEVDEVGR